ACAGVAAVEEDRPDLLGVTSRVFGSFDEAVGDRHQPAFCGASRHPPFELGVLLEDTHRAPERAVDLLALLGVEAVGPVLMTDVTLVADDVAFPQLPQRAAAVRARE